MTAVEAVLAIGGAFVAGVGVGSGALALLVLRYRSGGRHL